MPVMTFCMWTLSELRLGINATHVRIITSTCCNKAAPLVLALLPNAKDISRAHPSLPSKPHALTFPDCKKFVGAKGKLQAHGRFFTGLLHSILECKKKRVGLMIWDLVGKVCESPNDKLWNCSSISETNGKLWNQKEPSILPTKLADVGAITISKQLIWHVQQLHKRSSTAKKKVAKLLNTERCESKNLGKHHSISVDWAFTITLSFFFQTTPRWNYQYLPWGWGWWCPTSHPGTRFPVLEPPPGTLQRRSPGESSHSVGCLGISGRCLAGSHGKCLTPVTWSVKREKKSCQRVALHIPWYKILASPDLCKISVRSLKRISNYIDQK